MIKSIGKAARAIFIGLLTLLLLLNVWQIVSRYIFKQPLPNILGYSPVIVLSGSMEPTFCAGDLLIVREKENYNIQDIVTFNDGGTLTTHRIVAVSQEGYITKGDHNNAEDKKAVLKSSIYGCVAFVIPSIGKLFLFLRTPLGIFITVAFSAALLLLPDLLKKLAAHRKECVD